MLAAGPARRHYNPGINPILDLIRKLSERGDLQYIAVDKAGVRLELRRHAACATADNARRSSGVNQLAKTAAAPRLKGLIFDLDGTLLLSDRSLGGYEILPGAAELLAELARQAIPFVGFDQWFRVCACGTRREIAQCGSAGAR